MFVASGTADGFDAKLREPEVVRDEPTTGATLAGGLAVTRCKDLGLDLDVAGAGTAFTRALSELLGYRPEISGEG